jgi:uncharacterized protein (UPF0333 family)
MGTFTLETAFGLLLLGTVVIAVMATIGFFVVNLQQKKRDETENKSSIQKQIEELRR